MVTDIDVYRGARVFIRQYGAFADIEVMKRQQELLDLNDVDGARIWKRIGDVIDWMTISSDLASGLAANDC